jgi:hypothetical protein
MDIIINVIATTSRVTILNSLSTMIWGSRNEDYKIAKVVYDYL